jgi:very-short-patch-repair endonuclease
MTDAEQLLWYRLRRRQVGNHRFRRQVPLGPYIVDFCCVESRIVVEVDGNQHMESRHDSRRDAWLASEGYRVLRFWNHDVLARTDAVLAQILGVLPSIRPLPPFGHLPPQAVEGKKPPRF